MKNKGFFGYLEEDGKAVKRVKLIGPDEIAKFVCSPENQRYCRLVTDANLELKIVEFDCGDDLTDVQAAFGDAVKTWERGAIEKAILREYKRQEQEKPKETVEEDWLFDAEEEEENYMEDEAEENEDEEKEEMER